MKRTDELRNRLRRQNAENINIILLALLGAIIVITLKLLAI